MKPYTFNGEEFSDLNSLGLAFANNISLALEAIQQKDFLKFVAKFKDIKKEVRKTLYETRFLQNALSFIIYMLTENHLLIIGGKKYDNLEAVLSDLKNNDLIPIFVEEKGFSKTILNALDNEKLKADLQAFEDYPDSSFAYNYFTNLPKLEDFEGIDVYFKPLFENENGKFKFAQNLFKEEKIARFLATKYSLRDVLAYQNDLCPVFKGMLMLKGDYQPEEILTVFRQAFYWHTLEHLGDYKFKTKQAKLLLKELKKADKLTGKKYETLSLEAKIDFNEKIYIMYLELVGFYKTGEVLAKVQNEELVLPYCNTFVSNEFCSSQNIVADEALSEADEIKFSQIRYDLNAMETSIKTHKAFATNIIVWAILLVIYYVVATFVDALKPAITGEFSNLPDLLFVIGVALSIVGSIYILVLRIIAKKKFYALCRLKYYRKNEKSLILKQQKDYEKISEKELKYSKQIDRFYRFYGAVCCFALGLAFTFLLVGVIAKFGANLDFMKDLDVHANAILDGSKVYLGFIPAGVCLVVALLRHKKTGWSAFFSVVLAIILSIIICLF